MYDLSMEKNPIPTLLITGFLGAGKTTFINWLLTKHPEKKISIILNEFGDIKLESQFVKNASGEVVELANGCMCCVARVDVPRVISYITEHAPATEHLLIEASGLSDPEPVTAMLKGLGTYGGSIRYDANLCIVDALNFDRMRKDHPIILSQVGDADMVLISKVSEAGTEKTGQLKSFLENLLDHAAVILFDDSLSPDVFLDPPLTASDHPTVLRPAGPEHIHERVQTYWFTSRKPMDFNRLSEVFSALPDGIIRAKGYVWCEATDLVPEKILVQYIGSRHEFIQAQWKDGEAKTTAILFIGNNFDCGILDSLLKGCETDQSISMASPKL